MFLGELKAKDPREETKLVNPLENKGFVAFLRENGLDPATTMKFMAAYFDPEKHKTMQDALKGLTTEQLATLFGVVGFFVGSSRWQAGNPFTGAPGGFKAPESALQLFVKKWKQFHGKVKIDPAKILKPAVKGKGKPRWNIELRGTF